MRTAFVERVLRAVLAADANAASARWLAVCAGAPERDLFVKLGFTDVTISNLDVRLRGDEFAPYAWSAQNAQALEFPDQAFDYAFVSDGLHHCSSPHRGLLEMYRVSRKAIVVVESRDSALVRLAERWGLAERFEIDAVIGNGFAFGGVNNSQIPNFVYRWTERELAKTVQAYDPSGAQEFRFFYALNLPDRGNRVARALMRAGAPALQALAKLFRRQCNSFAMIAYRPSGARSLWPWLARDGGQIAFRRDSVSLLAKHDARRSMMAASRPAAASRGRQRRFTRRRSSSISATASCASSPNAAALVSAFGRLACRPASPTPRIRFGCGPVRGRGTTS